MGVGHTVYLTLLLLDALLCLSSAASLTQDSSNDEAQHVVAKKRQVDPAILHKLPFCQRFDGSRGFRCSDGGCVELRRLCDDEPDCTDSMETADDENAMYCSPNTNLAVPCSTYQCNNGRCLPWEATCDGDPIHCEYSGEDESEELCGLRCPGDVRRFHCNTSICISRDLICDKHCDCEYCDDEAECVSHTYPCRAGSQFRCDDGTCIHNDQLCDGNQDCKSDNEDEGDCYDDNGCHVREFYCPSDYRCLHRRKRCDGVKDCSSGADEEACGFTTCFPNEFRCEIGMCIDREAQCNGQIDCPQRGDDELGCKRECTDEEFTCLDGDCIPLYRACDGFSFDCKSILGEDEDGCGQRNCPEDWYTCYNGRCLPPQWTCDGDSDCSFGEDEAECGLPFTTPCFDDEFYCGYDLCISRDWQCDGYHDCDNALDEQNCALVGCPGGRFDCGDGGITCPNFSTQCDGYVDCPNGLDEVGCTLPVQNLQPPTPCPVGWVLCGTNYCVEGATCDGVADCRDGRDEIDCPSTTTHCSDNEVDCGNNYCVAGARCDGSSDCSNGRDEEGCSQPFTDLDAKVMFLMNTIQSLEQRVTELERLVPLVDYLRDQIDYLFASQQQYAQGDVETEDPFEMATDYGQHEVLLHIDSSTSTPSPDEEAITGTQPIATTGPLATNKTPPSSLQPCQQLSPQPSAQTSPQPSPEVDESGNEAQATTLSTTTEMETTNVNKLESSSKPQIILGADKAETNSITTIESEGSVGVTTLPSTIVTTAGETDTGNKAMTHKSTSPETQTIYFY